MQLKSKYTKVVKNFMELLIQVIDPHLTKKKILLEVNIFNFSGNLYNKKLSVEFLKFIRGEKKFKGISELKNQIKKDILKAKKI